MKSTTKIYYILHKQHIKCKNNYNRYLTIIHNNNGNKDNAQTHKHTESSERRTSAQQNFTKCSTQQHSEAL